MQLYKLGNLNEVKCRQRQLELDDAQT